MKKRFIAALLSLCMTLTLLPTTAFAALSDSLGNTPEENQAILEQLSALTGGSSDQVLSMLNALGLLDEDGNFKVDQTITLDGQVLTLAAVMELLENPATDLTRIADVDGTPVALGDLKTMIQIEQELQRIKDTYFSGREFTGEALENLNSLMEQLELQGISLRYPASATAPEGVETVDMSGMRSKTLEELANNKWESGTFTVYGGKPVSFSYRIQEGQLSEYITDVKISIGNASGVLQGDGSYKLTYTRDDPNSSLGGCQITVEVKTKGGNPAWLENSYSYGDLLGMIEFYDAENLVFYDGTSYADHHQLKLIKTVPAPAIKTSMTAPSYVEEVKNTTVLYDDLFIPLLAESYTGGSADNSNFIALSNTIGILEGARNSVLPSDSSPFYQPYQIDASIEFSWSGDIAAYNGPAPYGYYNSKNPRPYAPFCLTEYKLDGTALTPVAGEKKTENCTINNGSTVSISLQSTTKNRASEKYYLPFELYLKNVNNNIHNSTTTAKTSNATAKLVDTDKPTIQSVTAPAGTYASGQHVPITVTFNEFVDLRSASVTINGKDYSAAELSMNDYGVTAMLWYPVQDADDTKVTISNMTGVEDVFGNELDISLYQGDSIAKVELKSVLMRNAPTELTAAYANGKASFMMQANMEEAYMTVYSNYHIPAGTEPREAPFQLELKYGSAEAPIHLQVYLDAESGDFTVSDYEIAPPSDFDRTYTVTLQANEGTKADPDWVNVLPLTRQFTVQKRVPVSTVTIVPEANDADYTISLADTTRPTLKAMVLGAGGEQASYTTGKWSSSDPLIATIDEDTGLVATTGAKVGTVIFTFTADNGTVDTDNDDVSGQSKPYTVTAGDSLALVIPGSASIVTRKNQPATVLWSSNAALMAPGIEFNYRIDLYEGNYANEAALSGLKPVAAYTAGKDKNSVRIPEKVLSKLSNGNTPAYTVRVSMPHPKAESEDIRLSALAWIIVQAPPATAKLTPPRSIYLKDTDGTVNIDWSVENATTGASQLPTLTITRVTEDNTTKVVDSERLSGTSGSFPLLLQRVKDGNLKDTYQVVLSVENSGEESPSTDSFPLYVYDADALKVQNDKGEEISKLTMDNTSKVSGTLPTDTAGILQLRQELGLIEYIGINYDKYRWNSFKDGIQWASDNNAISVNYKQGGLYEDIKNFSFDSYLPETKMALSGRANGTATVTATHAATGMSAAVQVTAKTLQNKFYLFQLTPAAETTLQYTDGTGAPKTVTTNRDGVLALYEPNGIDSEVSLRSGSGADVFLGTIYKENLRSGERDATKLQLYPLNTFSLRRVARASVTLITPGGDPLAGKTVTVRGGVYKNGGYCEKALLGSTANALVSGITGDTYTTDAAGTITVYLDSTQFWSAEKGESSTTALSALDQLEYILEISEIDGDRYYPLLLTVNGKLGVDDVMRTAEGVVSLERVPAGEANKPFIVAQSVDYGLANGQKVDVRSSTGKIGPNSSFKTASLHTTMFLWGEDIANAKNYSLKLADEYGVLPAAQSSSTKQYPFSSIPVAENDLTLTEATMTTSGWIADGKDVGMKTQLSLNGSLLQEKIMPFRVVDLTRVPKVTEDDRVTGILATMEASSIVKGVDFSEVDGSNILKVLTGRLDDLSGPVNTSAFKMIITPSEDPSVFRAMIWAGYNTLEMEDMDYSEDGVALGANVLTQNLEVGVPGTGDLSQMAKGTYDPKGEYKANSLADNVTSTDLNLQLEGFYEAEIRYNAEKKEWEVFTVGGGFTAGVGVGFSFSVNAMAGPVPLTATFELGGAIQLDFRTAVRYGQQGEGLAWSDPTATAVNDFLTTLRINAYVHAFGGIGFDYSVVALKIGLFGNLDVDSQNKFLSRTYLADETKRQLKGQALGIQSEVGIKFVASFLFISYEAVIASGTFGATRTFNDWKKIDDYWNSATSGLSLASLQMAAAQSGMQVASASATLQSRDYLEQYARTWGQPQQRMMLLSLNSPSGLENIQTNANPTSYPQLSDDGKVLAYINDGSSRSIYDSRAHFSTLSGGVYTPSIQIDDPTGFTGYGDTSVSLSGTDSFAAAAWVRMGTDLPGKNAGAAVTLEEQNLLMNSTEIVVSVYNGTNWTSTRLTKDGTPDLAPATAVGGDGKAIVFWRSVYTPDPVSASGSNNLLNFTTRDCIMYSCYDSTKGTWSKAQMLYNGATGRVKALQAAMLPDGTAMAVYSLDRSGTGDTSAYEIAYCTVAADGTLGTAMLATCDSNLDENPQVVAANFGSVDDRFVIGWHSVRDGSSDIQLLAVDGSGTMSNRFPGSLSALTSSGNAVVGGDFRFASLSGAHRSLNDLTVVWNETVNDAKGAVDHGILKAAKLRHDTNTYTLSAPLELAELPDRTLADHFDAYVSGTNQVQAVIQATLYDDRKTQVINGVTVPGEKTNLYTATSDFITDAVAVEQIGVDYATLALNSLTPISFTIRNTGLNDVRNLTVSLGSGETATLTETLLPNESTTLTVWHHVEDHVTDPRYTITADGINEEGKVYLDYPDIGISQMEVIAESAGKRTVRMTLYNSSAATLASGKGREVKLAFYADDLHTKPAKVACTTNGVSVRNNEITISEDIALARIDQGTFALDLTYDLGEYMNSIGKTEIPNVGTYLYAEAWAEGQIGGTGSNQRLPEYDGSDSEASVHMTGALARTGERLTMDVAQGNDGNGHSTAAITLRNNCLQSQTSAALVATLLDAAGTVLETKKTSIGGAISGETFRMETVTFSKLGTRVVVRAAVPGNDLLTFEGLAVGLGDFTANGTNYTYTLQNDSGATSTLVTAVSGNDEPVSINGQALSTGGSAAVAIPKSGTTNIVVEIGTKTYTLTILRNSGTGGNEGGGGSGYSYYTIKATAGAGGSISPSGNVSVREGRDQTFTITPDKGYAVSNVKIDGKSIGAVKSYTFENVSRTHTIEVIFMKANGNPQTGVFVDVATGSYYEDAVDWAVENGITKGTDDTHFSPDGICTRAQAVTFLWRAAGSPEPETRAMPFTDIPVGSYYYDAVLWAVENGITKGTSDTTFSPNMTCTRAQIVAFLWRSEKSPPAGTANLFTDVKPDAYYADAVLWAVKENITKGTTNTTFSPDADCTRAQIVTFLYRFTVE
ncbi:S-layer homology domain-containing protein [Oscillibacter valericigenes]|nr:S-layer homology domain-containing protein [Oscillibacter valericigenes]